MKATKEMIAAGAEAARKYMEEAGGNNPAVIWDAMWAAQPKEPEQEPDVYIPADALRQLKGTSLLILRSVPLYGYRGDGLTPLYTTPPQRKPLDIKTIKRIATYCGEHITDEDVIEITRRVEEEHSIKE